MKKILLIFALVYSFAASAQLDTTKQIQTISAHGYAYKHLQAIYAMLFPTDTLHLKYDWRGIAFKGTSPYFWNGSFWSAFGTGGGGADSATYATLYRLDTAKTNLRASIATKLNISDTANIKPRLYAGANITITGTYPNLTIASTGGGTGDTSTFIVDTLYNRIAKAINADSLRMKSIRIRNNTSTITPATTDSTLSWDLPIPDTVSISNRINAKVDTSAVVQIDTTVRHNNDIVYWDSAARKYKHKTDSVGTDGGGSGAFSALGPFRIGDEDAPSAGDSILKHTGFSGKYLTVFRGTGPGSASLQEHVFADTGWLRMTDSTIKFKPAFTSTDWFYIEARDSTAYTQLTLQAPDAPPSTTIAYVSSTDGGNNGGSGNTRTFSHTVSSGSDRYLLVGVIGDVTSGANDPVSVTYNGVSMTLIDSMKAAQGGNRYNYVWGLSNPDVGAHNVVVTFSSSHYILTGAIEYSGVQGVDVTHKEDVYTNSKTTSTTTTANNAWTVCFATTAGLSQSAGSGSTARTGAATNYWKWFDSGAAITPAGAYSMNTTSFSGSGICHIIVSLKPY